jgi:transposase
MNSTRKPRIQGKIAKLTAEQREQVHKWLREEIFFYREIAERMKSQFGVSISNSSLSVYYSTHYAEIYGSAKAKPSEEVKQ